ncbi:MAG: filamentous hemagglutinin N-terminal domain-containing protein, partial [Chthoniobacteraceae bacterium]
MNMRTKTEVSTRQVNQDGLNLKALAAAVAAAFWSHGALALPTGGQVTQGNSVISTPNATTMNINQTTGTSVINWDTFNIAKPESVIVTQPVGGSALYRVGAQSPSEIFGVLRATGSIVLSNPAGVYFMPGSSVDVKGLVATSLSISDDSFLSGNWVFSNGGGAGTVSNSGTITALGGYAVLAGPTVQNDGIINARMGTVALAAGDQVKLDMVGDGLISVQVPTAALNAVAINKGTLQADGGNVLMTARSANAILDTVVNSEGVIRADSIGMSNGVIVLDGGTAGVVSVSGTGSLSAQGSDAGTTGGTVKMLGDKVGLFDSASINASGQAGGGTVLVGGNYQGKGPEQNSSATVFASGASINADAVTNGNGGKIILWSNGSTRAHGTLTARGGSSGGNGGLVETSGHWIDIAGVRVDTSAAAGTRGLWLIDPFDVTIVDGIAAGSTLGAFDAGNPNTWAPSATGSTVTDGDINLNLVTADVTITTTNGGGAEAGNITVSNGVVITNGAVAARTLTLAADGAAGGIIVNGNA